MNVNNHKNINEKFNQKSGKLINFLFKNKFSERIFTEKIVIYICDLLFKLPFISFYYYLLIN